MKLNSATQRNTKMFKLANCRFELLTETDDVTFIGIGKIWIGDTLVRSGRLPIVPYSQSFVGAELSSLSLLETIEGEEALMIRVRASFTKLPVQLMRDHSFDPIHDLNDWDEADETGEGIFTLLIKPSQQSFNSCDFSGFSYQYIYESATVPLFYILDKASWEINGDINGATIYSQSSCSDPVVTIEPTTAFTTEGVLFFLDVTSNYNRCMTHNLPRWASHQAFDFQFRGNQTLIGLFDHVDLIRSVLVHEAGKAELKTIDKHIFDQTYQFETSAKSILLNNTPKNDVDQQNIWSWIFDSVHRRAREEFGLKEQPPIPIFQHHHWQNYTIDTYYKDIVPACSLIGMQAIYAENFKKSDASEVNHLPNGNMCGSMEYEIAPSKGGIKKFTEYIERCHKLGIKNYMWTNTYVSLAAEMNSEHRCDKDSWYCSMEDTRLKYGGAYTSVSSNLDFSNPRAYRYWVDAHKKIVEQSGLDGYFIDSFYNLFFMPVSYGQGRPHTMWRQALQAMKELQDFGIGWHIESFGPFGQPGHGHPSSYNLDKIFICYYVGIGDDYVTVPVAGAAVKVNFHQDYKLLYYQFANKVPITAPLTIDGKRIDEVYGEEHRRVIAEYHRLLPEMYTRYLQDDAQSVLWHDQLKEQALIWNFNARNVALPGIVTDITTGKELPRAEVYFLDATHVYRVSGCELPVRIITAD